MQKSYIQNLLMKYAKLTVNFLSIKENVCNLLGGILIIYMLNPMFSFSNQLIFMALFGVWFFLVIVINTKWILNKIKTKVFMLLCVFPLISFFYWIAGFSLLNKHILLIPCIYVFASYYLQNDLKKILKVYCLMILVYVGLICIVTLIQLHYDPGITRLLARGDKAVIEDFITPFTATYATVYSIMLISILIFGVSLNAKDKKIRLTGFVISILTIYFMFKAAYSIAMILLLLGYLILIVIKIWRKIKNKRRATFIFVFSIIILFILYLLTKDFIADNVLKLTLYTSDMMQQRRIREISELIRNVGIESEGGMINRFQLYFLSLNTFFAHPIIGVGFRDEILHTTLNVVNPLVGGHSTILDILASYGIFGVSYIWIIPLVYYEKVRKNVYQLNNKSVFITVFLIFIILSLINTSQNIIFYITMIFVIPSMLNIYQEIDGTKENNLMNYALIGCGRISPNHIAAALKNELNIVAICDVVEEHMDSILLNFNLQDKSINRYTDYKEMIKDEKIDLVAIATESGLHAEVALDCIAQKINCIIEKPIAMSMKDARLICDAAKKQDVVVCANHQNRFNKSIVKIREAIDNKSFGKLLHATAHVRWNRNEGYYTQAPWRGTWEQDGGCLMNQCIHNIDLLRWMMGDDIVEVMAYTDNLNHSFIEAEDLGLAIVKFKNGAYGMIEGTTNVYPKNLEETLYIFGEKGTVKAGGKSVNIIEEWLLAESQEDAEKVKIENSEEPDSVYGFGHNPLYSNVINAIKNHTKPLVDAEAGMRALELVLAIYQSAYLGKPVKLPLDDVASTDFAERFKK